MKPYKLDGAAFKKLFLIDYRDAYNYEGGEKGDKIGIGFSVVNVSHGYDKMTVKVIGMAEPPNEILKLGEDIPEETEVVFDGLEVTQYAPRDGFGLALKAEATDVRLANDASGNKPAATRQTK